MYALYFLFSNIFSVDFKLSNVVQRLIIFKEKQNKNYEMILS